MGRIQYYVNANNNGSMKMSQECKGIEECKFYRDNAKNPSDWKVIMEVFYERHYDEEGRYIGNILQEKVVYRYEED